MFSQRQKLIAAACLAIVPIVGMFAAIQPAQAAHKYRFTGTCHNFHGEEHLIQALIHMDGALLGDCRHDRVVATVLARKEVLHAYREFCCPVAKRELRFALVDLARYMGTMDPYSLDEAHQHILSALDRERVIHAPVHVPVHTPPVFIDPSPVCDPIRGCDVRPPIRHHGRGYDGPHRRPVSFQVHGRKLSFGFSF